MRVRSVPVLLLAGTVAVAIGTTSLTSCTSDASDGAKPTSSTVVRGSSITSGSKAGAPTKTTPTPGPAAKLEELTGGQGVRLLAAQPGPDLKASGYTEHEYKASGTATSYVPDKPLATDGAYYLKPDATAPYATRIIVRRPAEQADFNGTVVVEWLNVSSGADAAPDYTYLADELIRSGYAWVGVSAQRIGVEGGEVAVSTPLDAESGAGKGLKALDPARYSSLSHPGDAFSCDMFTQASRAIRDTSSASPMKGLKVTDVLAAGESQSAFALTTYANGVQPLTHQFDGFLIHSRAGAAAPLGEAGSGVDVASTIGGAPTTIRTDLEQPVMMVQTETDVLGILNYYPARQPDTDKIRLWEVAGTAHADTQQVGPASGQLGCLAPINNGQQIYVLRSALGHLDAWVKTGAAPPKAARLDTPSGPDGSPMFHLDANGNVTGGIRTPAVDAPMEVLSGLPVEGSSIVCILMGSTAPLPKARVTALYPAKGDYEAAYKAATDDAITAGFILPADRAQVLKETSARG